MSTKSMVEKKRLLIVSLDAVSDNDVDRLLTMPNFGRFCRSGTLVRQVSSIFISNTYPVHTTITTGCHPYMHGITENTIPSPGDMNPDWNWYDRYIKTPTIYSQAAKFGYKTASILWPVTAGAKINYNIPEIFANRWWKNHIVVSLLNGSPLVQLRAVLKFGRNLSGASQPQLDDFSCASMCDILKNKKPELSMLHFTDVDTHKHKYGINSPQTSEALKRIDERLGRLFSAITEAGIMEHYNIILFGDHSMLNVEKSVHFNYMFKNKGLLKLDRNGIITTWRAWLKCCGGSAFLYLKDKNDTKALALARECIMEIIQDPLGGVKRFLDEDEMKLSGLDKECPFGIEAETGYEFDELKAHHKGAHGYSLKQKDYKTFYAASGNMINSGTELSGGNLTEVAPLALRLLNLPEWKMDGKLRDGP
jgi:predicted AlkP superfamily pyrophosphatase or phosphodiesterase